MFRTIAGFVVVLSLLGAWGCGDEDPGEPAGTPEVESPPENQPETNADNAFWIDYPAILEGGFIPDKHTGHGADVSPELVFHGVSERAVELALIVDDPDAPTADPWVHWVIYGIPADATGLPEGFAAPADGPIREGRNSWPAGKTIGWRGPLPPSGTHRYVFHLYALSKKVKLPAGATKAELLAAISDSTIEIAELEVKFAAK